MFHKRGSFNPTACRETSELWGTGNNTNGQLGQLDRLNRSDLTQVSGSSWREVATGLCFELATCADGTLWAWGLNAGGQLGQLDRNHRSSPTQIPGTTWQKVAGGTGHSLAMKSDGTLWSWGANSAGQLGQNDLVNKSSPVQVPGTDWLEINATSTNSSAIKSDNTLWVWGTNTDGQLGQSNRVHRSSPVQIPGTTWCLITNGPVSASIKTDNTLWMWGKNNNGQLGQSDRVSRSSPVQVPGTTWISVKTGVNHTLALKSDGTLWAWGDSTFGQLGLNDRTRYSSPVQIPGTTWCEIFALTNGTSSFAKRTDGTLWAWGENSGGQLGIGNITNISSPVQIPGTDWKDVQSSSDNTFLIKDYVTINGTYDANNLANIWANDSSYILFNPSNNYDLNDELYARDFRFCMGPKSKIIQANVITRINSEGEIFTGIYGGTSNGWYKIQLIDNNGDIGPDIGSKSSSGFSNQWADRFAKIDNPGLTPSQVMANTFGVKLGALSNGSPAPSVCIDSVHISLTTENSANSVTQGSQFWQWNNLGDVI